MKTRFFFFCAFFISYSLSGSTPLKPDSGFSSVSSSRSPSPRSVSPFLRLGAISPVTLMNAVRTKISKQKCLPSGLPEKEYETFIKEAQWWGFDKRSHELHARQWRDERLQWVVDKGVRINFYHGLAEDNLEFYKALRNQMGRLLPVCNKLIVPSYKDNKVSGDASVFYDFINVLNGFAVGGIKNPNSAERIKKMTTLIAFTRDNQTTFTEEMRLSHNQRRKKGKKTKDGVRPLTIMAVDALALNMSFEQMNCLKNFCR